MAIQQYQSPGLCQHFKCSACIMTAVKPSALLVPTQHSNCSQYLQDTANVPHHRFDGVMPIQFQLIQAPCTYAHKPQQHTPVQALHQAPCQLWNHCVTPLCPTFTALQVAQVHQTHALCTCLHVLLLHVHTYASAATASTTHTTTR